MCTEKTVLKLMLEKGSRMGIGELAEACGVSVEGVSRACEALGALSGGEIVYGGLRSADGVLSIATALMPRVIEKCVEGVLIGREVVLFPETDSTNDVAWGYSGRAESSGLVVFAESQRKGRGRFSDRVWYDVPGRSILMSVLVDGGAAAGEVLDVLGVGLGLAAAKAIEKVCGLEVGIKWPNDILAGGKKLCGIMVESRVVDGRRWYVLGVGINCNQEVSELPEEVRSAASSIYIESGVKVDRNLLAIELIDEIDMLVAGKVARGEVCRQWVERCCDVGREVVVVCDGVEYAGVVVKVEPVDGMVVRLADGSEKFFDARKINLKDE